MGISIQTDSRKELIFFSIMLMLVALFTSRFLLSAGLILFLFLTCFHNKFFQQLHSFIKNPFLVGISILFLLPFVSWFWTEDKTMWMRFVRIKLPLFLFPVAFAGQWQLTARQWRWIAYSFLFLVFAGCCWSLWQYLQNIHSVHQQYLQAKLLPTPLENDHVRYSLLVTITVLCAVLLLKEYKSKKNWLVLCLLLAFSTIYLHILSARTGLISYYLILLAGAVYLLLKLKRTKWVLVLLVIILTMPVAAWFLFPTFQNRMLYSRYDLSNARENKYVPGANDGNRILSLKAGLYVLNEHPWGVGADIVDKTYEWYERNVPEMKEPEKLFPSSEPLMYAGFAGWIGFTLYGTVMLLPFFEEVKRHRFFWIVLNILIAFSLLFDIGLEAQFGVFIYSFVVLWWWKWFRLAPANNATL